MPLLDLHVVFFVLDLDLHHFLVVELHDLWLPRLRAGLVDVLDHVSVNVVRVILESSSVIVLGFLLEQIAQVVGHERLICRHVGISVGC